MSFEVISQLTEYRVVISGTKYVVLSKVAPDVAASNLMSLLGCREEDFQGVYLANPTPHVSSRYGAPMGRGSIGPMDYESEFWIAEEIELDEGGYDPGGAYWGLRSLGEHLYAVQDGLGSVRFVDASSSNNAIQEARKG